MYSKTLVVFLVVYILSDFSHGQKNKVSFRKDYTYIEAGESFYKFHTIKKNWRDAKRECALEGASLFYPENRDEANAVISFWKLYQNSTQPHTIANTWLFLGISDIITEGVFETIDGKSISDVYNNWYGIQPDNSGDEDCVHLNQEGKINDIKCDAEYSFICKKSLPSLERNCSCNIQQSNLNGQKNQASFRKDYTYIEAGESFYKFHMTKKNWRDAKRKCALEGARLFYPENRDEANAVISFWKLYQNSTQSQTIANTWVSVGISDIITEGVYETIDGKSISEVYINWYGKQPDNWGDEDCVHLNQEGYNNDIECDAEYSFICKKSLPSLERNCSCNIQQSNLGGKRDKKFFRKDYSYLETTDGFYKIHTIQQTWAEAKRVCALEGASFYYPDNTDESNAVILFWKSTRPNIPEVYVGLSDINEEEFDTVDGNSISEEYTQWKLSEPNDSQDNEDENCSMQYLNGDVKYVPCKIKSNFICKKSFQSLEWNHSCNMPNLDYTFNKGTGKCYKFHTTPLKWTEAYAVCSAEQSNLAVISNQSVADYLVKLTESAPKQKVKGNYIRGIYHVGFHNRFNKGWQTVKGTPLNDTEAWWGNYIPEADDREQCGSMFFNGLLTHVDCDMRSFFICEHESDSATSS